MVQEDKDSKSRLSRNLNMFHLVMMGTGMMIGAGIFVTTGIGIGISGPGGILIAISLNGLLAFLSAMSYAELSSVMPQAGGGYRYVEEAYGGIIGFMSGWILWLGSAIAGSLYAITFGTYTSRLLQNYNLLNSLNIDTKILETILAVVVIIIFAGINYLGTSETGKASVYITLGQLILMGIIGISGFLAIQSNPANFSKFSDFIPNGWIKILPTMGLIYIAFEGFEVIAQAGEEVKDPKKSIPKGILYTMMIVITTYLLVAFAMIVGGGTDDKSLWKWFEQQGSTGFASSIKSLLPYGGVLVSVAAIFASTSALNSTIYAATRVSYAMGKDGTLPKKVGRVSEKRKIPHIALLWSTIIIIIVAMSLPVKDVASGAGFMFLILFLFVNMTVIKIRKERGNELDYGYLMPFFPYIPKSAIVLQVILSFWIFNVSRIAVISGGIWILMGLIFYFFYIKNKLRS